MRFWVTELLANESECAIYVVGTKGRLSPIFLFFSFFVSVTDIFGSGDLVHEKKVRDADVEEYARNVSAKVTNNRNYEIPPNHRGTDAVI